MSATTAHPPTAESTERVRSMLTAAHPGRKRVDRTMTVLVWGAFALAMVPLISLLWTVTSNGIGRISMDFLTLSMRNIFGGDPTGGIYHAIMGTLIITGLATLISVPIGVLTAIYLVEYGRGALARSVTFFVDVMTGIPSIVAGLFAVALFTLILGPAARFGLIGAVALSVLMIPVVVRSCEEMLKLVPNELREAAYALGVPKWLTIVKVVLRTSVAGLTTGVLLAIARVIGETAPLLVAVGVTDSINTNPFEGRMMTLPVFAYRQYSQGLATCPGGESATCIPDIALQNAWGAALVLIVLVLLLNIIGRLVNRWFSPKLR
ncbi:phosphate ABC transporter membrane protein 2 (PhoT family) [Isoptericola sp. CG 20/1183]|uniref:Phosphate transport system permease protein PstA n=1 Tax=Isoptericola halotolerans TaxID=300560 RepID=A0ABX5EFP5_9MICO|nr:MULTISPECIES: phosphate ABC transporter permease PstA [Isoptericola]MCK0116348.1 phosphate ABC transporter permease PstA [Isoptericola sp. S6320L]PRZ08168.1 phosphate ABC transporter membrane protein 2 (PhoT family) [Isoptericola halotolerans]PRZ08965.1 phosphate ABC transporter membrane protein 2 (PhoT family) [Isoptericola sp. CG 20/1183]